jgi:LSD1 subclass zinc finger protein
MPPRSGPWGAHTAAPPAATAAADATVSTATPRKFACESCGAVLGYSPGTTELVCAYCGHANKIVERAVEVTETDLTPVLKDLAGEQITSDAIATKCQSCGADFSFPPNIHAGACPFCNMAVVADPTPYRRIHPQGLLPFVIGEQEARRLVRDWLKSLWFAPSNVSKDARHASTLKGLYVPYWTFDAETTTDYVGQRGDVYYETRLITEVVNGRQVERAVQVPRIAWSPASGRVRRSFDDVLVVAGLTLPRNLVQRLEPWDVDAMKPYAPDFLSGFESELYQLPLEQGLGQAKEVMQGAIVMDVRADIGGDQQQIASMGVTYDQQTFKHVLLPVWVAAFQFLGRPYRFVVNGRTGEVHGERPWSVWKIAGAVVVGLLLLVLLLWLGHEGEIFRQATGF